MEGRGLSQDQHDDEATQQREVGQWRQGHGAIFFVFMCLLVILVGFAQFGGFDLIKAVGHAASPAQTGKPE